MTQLFYKEYDGESLYDFYRDMAEAVTEEFNPLIGNVPLDRHGFQTGTFKVTITWEDN